MCKFLALAVLVYKTWQLLWGNVINQSNFYKESIDNKNICLLPIENDKIINTSDLIVSRRYCFDMNLK